MRAVWSGAAVVCGLMLLVATGCGPGPKDQQIEAMQAEINKLQGEKQDLIRQLDRMRGERDAALARARALEQQLAGMQAPTEKRPPGWEDHGPLAWKNISEDILFDSGKADLKPSGRRVLETVLSEARETYPGRQLWFVGHTDTDPIKHSKWKDNLELSVERGATVFREMQKLGVNPAQMVAAGQGEFHPIAPNTASAGKAKNRRVQVIAIDVPPEAAPTELGGGERGYQP